MHPLLLEKNRILVAGHRGCGTRTEIPENTLFSFEKAIAAGVDMLELDLSLTKDLEVIIMHDATVDRTTDGNGNVKDFTLAEIKQLDAGIKWGEAYAGLAVPTFEEFCSLMDLNPHVLLNVEIKDISHLAVDKAIEILTNHNMVERCVFTCWDATILHYLFDKYRLPCQGFPGFRMKNFVPGTNGTFARMAAVGIGMKDLTRERVQDFVDMGILPWAWCPDDEESVQYAKECGVTLITVNRLEPALQICKGV